MKIIKKIKFWFWWNFKATESDKALHDQMFLGTAKETIMKKTIITILLLSFILVGCGGEKPVLEYTPPIPVSSDRDWEFERGLVNSIRDLYDRLDKLEEEFGKEKTYLTSDKYKVEWVELGCDKYFDKEAMIRDMKTPAYKEPYIRCQTLKDLIKCVKQ